MQTHLEKRRRTQRRFIENSALQFHPVRQEDIFDAKHIFPQIEQILDYLKNFKNYRTKKIGMDAGALFWGRSGTGKTSFARYIATVSGARFIDLRKFPVEIKSGVELWQPGDVRFLFTLAMQWIKKHEEPIVFFIDQIDDWLSANKGIASEFETQMDGINKHAEGIFIIATAQKKPTGFRSIFDEDDDEETFGGSLFRRGRIGIHIAFNLPDRKQQAILLKGFLSHHPISANIDYKNIVYLFGQQTTPAQLKYLVEETRRLSERRKRDITEEDLIEVFLEDSLDAPTGHEPSEEENRITRIHELGHYIIARAWGFPARFVSSRPGLESLGLTMGQDEEFSESLEDIRRGIAFSWGGMLAEELFGIKPNTGRGGDIQSINEGADKLVFFGDRKYLGNFSLLNISRDVNDRMMISQPLLWRYERELSRHIKRERTRGIYTLKFFGKKLIAQIEAVFKEKSQKVMLQSELDILLEPKLSLFHKKHKVRDRVHE